MRKFDFGAQTLLLGFALLSLLLGLTARKEYFAFFLCAQFITGAWQLLSAFITAMKKDHGNGYRTKSIRIYWMLVVFYFGILALLFVFGVNTIAMVWFFSAWLIAIYYYVFTIRLLFVKTARKTFLDVAN
jgi:hypothetical protein